MISNVFNIPFGVSIQRGDVNNFQGIQKFGYNSSVGTSFETIWDGGGDYTFLTSAGTATATSSNTGADDNGTDRKSTRLNSSHP